MESQRVRLFVILTAIVSGVLLDTNKDDDFYGSVSVSFSRDPCNDEQLEVPDFSAPGRRISEEKCLENIWRIMYQQGKSINRIMCDSLRLGWVPLIGGSSALSGEYPHMGALGWKTRVGTWIFKCGSSLISDKFVLTAAHCASVTNRDDTLADTEPKIVRLGSKSILDTYKGQQAYDVAILRFIKHPRYDALRQYYDIALIELEEEVSFRWEVHPSCLWTKFDNPENGMATGWGVIEPATFKTSPVLQKASIKIVDSDECDETLHLRRNRKWQGIVRHQLCAGDKTGRIDTCQGDSGGPLQTTITLQQHRFSIFPWNMHIIVGVTSFGFGCARKETPSVYTRVASFAGWIESIVWPTNATKAANASDRFLFET